ncbi:MAG: tyrosine-type recombinase/integrase [Chloroflexi bacterium]|nr:tyrosine-type recombinase/integrase [Chloroflexota bacterium]
MHNSIKHNYTVLMRAFLAALGSAGLPDMRVHDPRHSAASLLLAQGVELRMVMQALGHSRIDLTTNTYAHILPSLRRATEEQMEAILSGSSAMD